MTAPIIIERGKPYPLDYIEGHQFAAFFPGGSLLKVVMPNITKAEQQAYRQGKVGFRSQVQGRVIMTYWTFGKEPESEAPFDAKLARDNDQLDLADISENSRLFIQLYLIDSATGNCEGIRGFTLPVADTTRLTSAIMDQLSS